MSKRKTEIEKMLNRRQASYDRSTDKIFDAIGGIIEGIEDYGRQEDLLNDDNSLDLFSVLMETPGEESVTLVGAFKPNIGTTVMDSMGEQFSVETEDDQMIYAKMLRISLPYELIEKNDPAETSAYIEEATKNMEKYMKELQAQALAEEEDFIESPEEFEAIPEVTPVDMDEATRKDQERLRKILEGATNPSGLFN